MSGPLAEFCRDDYVAVLEGFLDQGYAFGDLEGLARGGRVAFSRHDVDLSLSHALDMARVEHGLGVRGTYYFLVSTRFYNLASAESRAMLRELVGMGHEVGLHFDATKYAPDRASLAAGAEAECAILEAMSGAPVTSLSFHRPAPALLGLEGRFAGRPHTYEPRFFKDVAYVSDSNGGWHHGHPFDHPAFAAGEPIQLLTHPIWWMQDQRAGVVAVLERLRRQAGVDLRRDLAGSVKQYAAWVAQVDAT